jgi:hypothetical protein
MLLASRFTLLCKVTVSWSQIDGQKGDLTGVKCTSTCVMVFDRVRLESS